LSISSYDPDSPLQPLARHSFGRLFGSTAVHSGLAEPATPKRRRLARPGEAAFRIAMCHQTTYMLPCEHVKTQVIYCAEASMVSGPRGKSGTRGSSRRAPRRPCRNLTRQSLPYPTPPSFVGSPSTAASSLLVPKCPLASCPFEIKNRCWNCCWCGKTANETGRCDCIMIIDGSEVQCEHLCCDTCEAASPNGV
jgi:hypothetical protein